MRTNDGIHASLSTAIGTAFGISITATVIFTFLDTDTKATRLNFWTLTRLRGSGWSCEWAKTRQAEYQAKQNKAKQDRAKQNRAQYMEVLT